MIGSERPPHFVSWAVIAWATVSAFVTLDAPTGAARAAEPDAHYGPVIPYGLAKPIRQVELAPRTPGVLMQVLVSAGDTVEQNAVLGVIDNHVALATVKAAESAAQRTAEIEQSRRALQFAHRQLSRYRAAQSEEAIAEIEVDNAAARVAEAEAVLESALESKLQAESNLQLEQARLEHHNIRAPFSGLVTKVHTQCGAALPMQGALLTLVDTSQLEVELFLDPQTIKPLQVGEQYVLQAAAPINGPVQATLMFISPIIESGTKSFRTVFLIDNAESKFPAGFAVRFENSLLRHTFTSQSASP